MLNQKLMIDHQYEHWISTTFMIYGQLLATKMVKLDLRMQKGGTARLNIN